MDNQMGLPRLNTPHFGRVIDFGTGGKKTKENSLRIQLRGEAPPNAVNIYAPSFVLTLQRVAIAAIYDTWIG